MEIKAIKAQLPLLEVVARYGLKPDKYHRLHCPFHDDKTPSLQLYPKTDTFCCFSSNCTAGTGDVIRFIELMEKSTKHQAILKAQSFLEDRRPVTPAPRSQTTPPPTTTNNAGILEKEALMMKAFSYFKKSLPRAAGAVAYLEGRGIRYQDHEVGYNSGGMHHESKNRYLVEGLVRYGLLKPKAASGYSVWAKNCVIFPLKSREGKTVSLYGRSITNNDTARHFYVSGREGLYPHYPEADTTKLILTESILDAASLLQQPELRSGYSVLALYGTNGLTEEHQQAILSLEKLQEIILMLDGDEAGRAATEKHARTLAGLLPDLQITAVPLPDGEDVNSLLQSHDDGGVLKALVEKREAVHFFVSMETPATEPKEDQLPSTPTPIYKGLDTRNPELLVYDSEALLIEVLGGIRITGLDRMKVTLKVTARQQSGALPLWHTLDLYHHGQREQAITAITDAFDASLQTTTATIAGLTGALESYRLQRIEALQPKQETGPVLTAAERQAAINELKKPDLLERTARFLALTGIVGEAANSLTAYLVYCTRKQAVPLHVMFLGASGSGKTYLQEKVSELIPGEDKIEITQITENALYYFKQQELKHKLILIEDLDGALAVFYPLRELQTKRRITKTVTLKDTRGNLKTITLTVEGPVSVSGCTTKEKLYEDNANRCILLYTDQSKNQDRRINAYQTKAAAGEVDSMREQQYKALCRNMQRVLQPIRIVNPYARHIALPDQVFRPRRTMTLLLGFIEAITFYHQYQREVKKDSSGQPYIETTVADIAAAFRLLKDVLFSKSDELARATRNFLEHLKAWLREESRGSFTAREIREKLRIHPSNLKRYLLELERYGYLKGSGNRYRNYEYQVTDLQEYEALKSSIEAHLQNILTAISTAGR